MVATNIQLAVLCLPLLSYSSPAATWDRNLHRLGRRIPSSSRSGSNGAARPSGFPAMGMNSSELTKVQSTTSEHVVHMVTNFVAVTDGAAGAASGVSGARNGAGACGPGQGGSDRPSVVYVTETEKVTMTVTAGSQTVPNAGSSQGGLISGNPGAAPNTRVYDAAPAAGSSQTTPIFGNSQAVPTTGNSHAAPSEGAEGLPGGVAPYSVVGPYSNLSTSASSTGLVTLSALGTGTAALPWQRKSTEKAKLKTSGQNTIVAPTNNATRPDATSTSSSTGTNTAAAGITAPGSVSGASSPTSVAPSATSPAANPGNGSFPFTQVVAFGDNLSDNGNGSYAHCVTNSQPSSPSCGNNVYGFGTWTDGPVAVSYLVDLLGVPLVQDNAYGHANGGSLFGATIDNAYTQSTANAPSAQDQINTYLGSKPADIGKTLEFLWIGANDINLYHVDVSSASSATNTKFATDMSTKMAALVQQLIQAGAGTVFVSNLYAKHISPSKEFYANTPEEISNLGSAIANANSAIESALKQFGDQVIYYNAYAKMVDIWNNAGMYGIVHTGNEFCDGYSQEDWDLCVTDKQGASFYWMQYLDMVTNVHKLLAEDMANTIKAHFA